MNRLLDNRMVHKNELRVNRKEYEHKKGIVIKIAFSN